MSIWRSTKKSLPPNSWAIEEWLESGSMVCLSGQQGNLRLLLGWGKRFHFAWPAPLSLATAAHFYFPDFFLIEKESWFCHEQSVEIGLAEVVEQLSYLSLRKQEKKLTWQKPSYEFFADAFCDLQQRFEKSQLEKAVPFVFEIAKETMQPSRLCLVLHSLFCHALCYPIYPYGSWERGKGIVGGTPERFFCYSEKSLPQLETVACAATAKNSCSHQLTLTSKETLLAFTGRISAEREASDGAVGDEAIALAIAEETNAPDERLAADRKLVIKANKVSKEQREHCLVIADIEQALRPYGKVTIHPTTLLVLSQLSHLLTSIDLSFDRKVAIPELINALHPTAALGVYPRQAGSKWLLQYEKKLPRGRFGAPVGCLWQQGEKGSFYVAIRNVQWDEQEMKIAAGCGMTAESQLEEEWQEILLKIEATKEILSL